MKNHSEIEKKLTDYIFGELSKEEANLVQEHLEKCPECCRKLEELKCVVGTLKKGLVENEVSIQPMSDLQRAAIFAAASEPNEGRLNADVTTKIDPSPDKLKEMALPNEIFSLKTWIVHHRRNLLSIAAGFVIAGMIWIIAFPNLRSPKNLASRAKSAQELSNLHEYAREYAPKPSPNTQNPLEERFSKSNGRFVLPEPVRENNEFQFQDSATPEADMLEIGDFKNEFPEKLNGLKSEILSTEKLSDAKTVNGLASIGDDKDEVSKIAKRGRKDHSTGLRDRFYQKEPGERSSETGFYKEFNERSVSSTDSNIESHQFYRGKSEKQLSSQLFAETQDVGKAIGNTKTNSLKEKIVEDFRMAQLKRPYNELIDDSEFKKGKRKRDVRSPSGFDRKAEKTEARLKNDNSPADIGLGGKTTELVSRKEAIKLKEMAQILSSPLSDPQVIIASNDDVDGRLEERETPPPVSKPSSVVIYNLSPEVFTQFEKQSRDIEGGVKSWLQNQGVELSNTLTSDLKEDEKLLVVSNPSPGENLSITQAIDQIQGQLDANKLKNLRSIPPMKDVEKDPFSTFSIDVDTASYTAARRDILNGNRPAAVSIRPEEFINYFDYKYKTPQHGTFSIITDYSPSPFQKGLHILRVALQGKRSGSDTKRPSCFTFVLDTSGSMAEPNRLPLIQRQIPKLLDQMRPNDLVTVITTDVTSRLVLDQVPAVEKNTIIQTINRVHPSGGTNLEAGLISAYNHAEQNYQGGAYNRVVLFSDGVANLGELEAEMIRKRVEKARKLGVTFTAVGVGRGLYNDKFLEDLADKGDGNYLFVDGDREADRVFVENFSANFQVIAKDVKIQVEFNPQKVKSYRLIGYDNRRLRKEDFTDNAVDAGEVGAGQSVTAVYEVEFVDDNPDKICDLRIRYKDPDTNKVSEFNRICDSRNSHSSFSASSWSFRLASLVAEFAEYLKYGPTAKGIPLEDLQKQLLPITLEMKEDSTILELNHLMMQVK